MRLKERHVFISVKVDHVCVCVSAYMHTCIHLCIKVWAHTCHTYVEAREQPRMIALAVSDQASGFQKDSFLQRSKLLSFFQDDISMQRKTRSQRPTLGLLVLAQYEDRFATERLHCLLLHMPDSQACELPGTPHLPSLRRISVWKWVLWTQTQILTLSQQVLCWLSGLPSPVKVFLLVFR